MSNSMTLSRVHFRKNSILIIPPGEKLYYFEHIIENKDFLSVEVLNLEFHYDNNSYAPEMSVTFENETGKHMQVYVTDALLAANGRLDNDSQRKVV